jgi:hypothetical protein
MQRHDRLFSTALVLFVVDLLIVKLLAGKLPAVLHVQN